MMLVLVVCVVGDEGLLGFCRRDQAELLGEHSVQEDGFWILGEDVDEGVGIIIREASLTVEVAHLIHLAREMIVDFPGLGGVLAEEELLLRALRGKVAKGHADGIAEKVTESEHKEEAEAREVATGKGGDERKACDCLVKPSQCSGTQHTFHILHDTNAFLGGRAVRGRRTPSMPP